MRVLAFDQSTNNIGWAVFQDEELIWCGSKSFKKVKDTDDRIGAIKEWMNMTIEQVQAEIVAVEEIQYRGNLRGFKPLAELLGVIKNNLWEQEMAYVLVYPSEWRKECGIHGRETKEIKANTQAWVRSRFGKDVDEDTADAIGIGYFVVVRKPYIQM